MSDKSDPSGDAENSRTEKPSRGGIFGRRASTPIELRSPPKPRRPRRTGLSSLSAFLSFVLIGAVIGLVAFAAAIVEERKTGPLAADKVVLIEREDDEGPIADQLERAGVIESAPLFSPMYAFLVSTKLPTCTPAASSVPGRRRANGPMTHGPCVTTPSRSLPRRPIRKSL